MVEEIPTELSVVRKNNQKVEMVFEEVTWESVGSYDQVVELLDRFTEKYPRSRWGGGHIVIEDLNLLDEHINFCLKLLKGVLLYRLNCDECITSEVCVDLMRLDWYGEFSTEEIAATFEFLNNLLCVPESVRNIYFYPD